MAKQVKKTDTDFEIAFYNGILQKKPDFIEAMMALGDLYTNAGMYSEGMAIDEKLVQLRPDDPVVLYNLACSYSLLNQINEAYRSVKKAINCGYSDFDHLERDQDLLNLRGDRRFQTYYSRVKRKKLAENKK